MLKYFFAVIVLIHGLIHFVGYARIFGNSHVMQFSKMHSKWEALLWLATAVIFIIATVLFLRNDSLWPYFGMVAAVCSQLLILINWEEARFGTIANILLLAVAIPSLAHFKFNKQAEKEARVLLSREAPKHSLITEENLSALPPLIQKWLLRSRIVGKEQTNFVRLQQKGKIRTKPNGRWMPMKAVQYFNVTEPGFVWHTDVQFLPGINMVGCDKFLNGTGEMQIKILSLATVVDVKGNEKINSAAMIRFLAETMWFPSSALNHHFKWEALNETTARVTMQYKGHSVSGLFKFDTSGDVIGFEADRYMETSEDAKPEKWLVNITAYKDFTDIRIPYKGEATWRLKDGDFTWFDFELTALEYNTTELFKKKNKLFIS